MDSCLATWRARSLVRDLSQKVRSYRSSSLQSQHWAGGGGTERGTHQDRQSQPELPGKFQESLNYR